MTLDSKGLHLGIWLVLTISGLVSTLLLARAEYRNIRRSGVSLTTGPNPRPTPAQTHLAVGTQR
jgi:hypothetical protein